jgi:predicted metalloprotease with PDZ domain
VTYTVTLDQRAEHRATVEMMVTGASGAVDLWMPVWTPGAYELRSWGRNVTPLSAVDGAGRALRFLRVGPSRFRVESASGTVTLRYRVHAPRLSDDGSSIDANHALINGSSLFLAVAGQEKGLHEVRVTLPSGWRAATALEEDVAGWQAIGYEQLIDAPIECGRFAETATRAAGAATSSSSTARPRCRRVSPKTWRASPKPKRRSPARRPTAATSPSSTWSTSRGGWRRSSMRRRRRSWCRAARSSTPRATTS